MIGHSLNWRTPGPWILLGRKIDTRAPLAMRTRSASALLAPYPSLEIYSRLALTDAQASYDQAIGRFPV